MLLPAEQSLRDSELPAAVKEKWVGQGAEPQFQLRLRASGIIRVQHRLDGDQEVSEGFRWQRECLLSVRGMSCSLAIAFSHYAIHCNYVSELNTTFLSLPQTNISTTRTEQ